MLRSESITYDQTKVNELRKLVSQGEGQYLEFKRKASYPDKIVRELIAFANTGGGILLIGVDDNKTIPGVKFPEEESIVIHDELRKNCRPGIAFHETVIPVSENRYVLQWKIPKSEKRPHFYVSNGEKSSYVRQNDQSIKASREMSEIIRRSKSSTGTKLVYGEAEQKIIHFLAGQSTISLKEVSQLTGLNRYMASRKIVRLVLANVLKITPTDKGDTFSRV
ncbi:MAG: ATP-binding protein [Cyclobacteriaceae bacterium]|nr:ATP-binding protein [Cyclobacteriaceae bacterium]